MIYSSLYQAHCFAAEPLQGQKAMASGGEVRPTVQRAAACFAQPGCQLHLQHMCRLEPSVSPRAAGLHRKHRRQEPKKKDPVIVAGKDAAEVDNTYFLLPVKILDHEGALGTSFPIENRHLPQGDGPVMPDPCHLHVHA